MHGSSYPPRWPVTVLLTHPWFCDSDPRSCSHRWWAVNRVKQSLTPPPPCDLLQCSSHPPLPTPPLTNYPGHSHYPCDFISTTHTTPDLVKVIRRLPVSADVLQTQSGNHPPYPPLVLTLPLTLWGWSHILQSPLMCFKQGQVIRVILFLCFDYSMVLTHIIQRCLWSTIWKFWTQYDYSALQKSTDYELSF